MELKHTKNYYYYKGDYSLNRTFMELKLPIELCLLVSPVS